MNCIVKFGIYKRLDCSREAARHSVSLKIMLTLLKINVKKTVVYTRVNGASHIENCKNYKKVITHQHIA